VKALFIKVSLLLLLTVFIEKPCLANREDTQVVKYHFSKTENSIIMNVKHMLRQSLSSQYHDVEIELATRKHFLKQELTFDEIKIKNLKKLRVNKRISVWVELVKNDKTIQEIPLWFKVKAFQYVWVALDDIQRNTTLASSLFELQLKDIATKGSFYYKKWPNGKAFWNIIKIKKGQVLTKNQIAPEPLVKRYQAINVEYRSNNIMIQIKGKALSNGFIGDRILIDIEESKKPISAVIIAKNKVKVV